MYDSFQTVAILDDKVQRKMCSVAMLRTNHRLAFRSRVLRGDIALLVVFGWLAVGLHLAVSHLAAADAEVRIEPREKWSAVFGESDVKFTFDISSSEPLAGRLIGCCRPTNGRSRGASRASRRAEASRTR